MQIGPVTPWNTTPHAELPVQRTPAPVEEAGAASGTAAAPAEDRDRRDILAEAAGSETLDPSQRPPAEQTEIAELKRRDQEVRQHEGAHMSAGNAHVRGGASYSYQAGPDGKRYAVGGEVSIDASPVGNNPEATIAKMQTVRRAALAPANPSGQDLAVAARASQAEMQARMQAAEQAMAAAKGDGPKASGQDPSGGPREEANIPSSSSPGAAVSPALVATGTLLDAYA